MQAVKQDPLSFYKMAGGGNDFVVIDHRTPHVADAPELARRACTRAVSIGADGLILVENSERASFRMRYYNSDGSLGEFCANGTRCAARFAFLNDIASRQMTIETDAGIVGAEVGENGTVTLSLPAPSSFRRERPVTFGDDVIHGSSILVGVPHYVVFADDDLWSREIHSLGRAIRTHPELQPEGANVNFVVVRDRHAIDVRTYERGVENETLSCGSGVVASSVVTALCGKTQSPISILTRSGISLEVSFVIHDGQLSDVRLRGDARVIYRATSTPETLEGFDADFVRDPAARAPVTS